MTDRSPEPHLVLLLGRGGLSPAAVLTSARSVTSRVSVVWCGGGGSGADNSALRDQWREHFDGDWLATARLDAVPDLVEIVHRRRPVDGVATFGEPLVVAQAEAQHRLGLPGNHPDVVREVQSKAGQRTLLNRAGVDRLRFARVTAAADLRAAADHVGFPAVLKPAWGAGSFLVSLVRDRAELEDRFRTALAAHDRSPVPAPEPLFVLEEYLRGGSDWHGDDRFGDYCSVETLIHDGRTTHVALTDKLPLHPGFVEAGDLLPSRLPPQRTEQILAYTDAVIQALGLRWGATHTEIKLTPDGPACIELNARLGGASAHFVQASTDADLAADVMRNALGLRPAGDYQARRHALFGSVPPPAHRARLERQQTVEELRSAFPELRFCKTRYQVGEVLEPTVPFNLMTYLVTGTDVDSVLDLSAAVERAYRPVFSLPEDAA